MQVEFEHEVVIPRSVLVSAAFLRMNAGEKGAYLSLWACCDQWGRGPWDEYAVFDLMRIDMDDPTLTFRGEAANFLTFVQDARLVVVYEVGDREYFELVDFERDLERSSGRGRYPGPDGIVPRSWEGPRAVDFAHDAEDLEEDDDGSSE